MKQNLISTAYLLSHARTHTHGNRGRSSSRRHMRTRVSDLQSRRTNSFQQFFVSLRFIHARVPTACIGGAHSPIQPFGRLTVYLTSRAHTQTTHKSVSLLTCAFCCARTSFTFAAAAYLALPTSQKNTQNRRNAPIQRSKFTTKMYLLDEE